MYFGVKGQGHIMLSYGALADFVSFLVKYAIFLLLWYHLICILIVQLSFMIAWILAQVYIVITAIEK